VYTFRDREGNLYTGAPRSEYGVLTPISDENSLDTTRPGAFASGQWESPSSVIVDPLTYLRTDHHPSPSLKPGSDPLTFRDILSPDRVTTLSELPVSTSPLRSAWIRLMKSARRKTSPMMRRVVHILRRSKSSPGYLVIGSKDAELQRTSESFTSSDSRAESV
jgi:hypothetical protein